MSLEEVGEIYYFSNNIIVWRVPDFSSLPLREGSRIYSPLFCFAPEFNRNFPKNPAWNFEPLNGYVGLIFTSKKFNDRPRDIRMEFGVLNINNTENGNFTGQWMDEEESTGYFRVRSLIAGENVGGIYTTPIKKVYIRIFAEASSKEINRQKRNAIDTAINAIANEELENNKESKNENCNDVESINENKTDAFQSPLNFPFCIVCCDTDRDICFQPCGHLICCSTCADAIDVCPYCRRPVINKFKTYIS